MAPMRFFFSLVLILSFVLPARAQDGTIEGRVTDALTAAPLGGANVSVAVERLGAATDRSGRFVIDNVPPGTHDLTISMIGYRTNHVRVEVQPGTRVRVNVVMEERPVEIDEIVVERVTLTGGTRGIDRIPGSAHYISPQELDRHSFSDPHRVLRRIPGVSIQEEDGFGLRPNIGMRGTGVERSSKITIMEDGVLMAPAPYSGPAAYYFPTMGRMQAVEVRKGSSQIKYGPYTTGGALNLISTQIPSRRIVSADVMVGGDDARTVHAFAGDSFTRFGYLVETHQASSGGFKDLDGGGPTGFVNRDYLAKLQLKSSPEASLPQALTLKIGAVSHRSDETYLGLTPEDFERSPFRRYSASQMDEMTTEHRQYVLRHVIRPASFLDVTTTAYHTTFSRNWYKLDAVRPTAEGSAIKIAELLDRPEDHPEAFKILTGESSHSGDALDVKANNRTYFSRGVQTLVGVQSDRFGMNHDVEVGLRYHEDQVDRFQWTDAYRMDTGVMQMTSAGTPGTESNRVEDASAVAAHVQYRVEAGRVGVTPGMRYEHVVLRRTDYGKNDVERTGANVSTARNEVSAWIPGLGVDYLVVEGVKAFAGVHKGFAPPGPREGTDAESSINYEAGARFRSGTTHVEAVGFFNDYSNLLGSDLAAGGGEGTGRVFNGGEVHVTGIELSAHHNFGRHTNWSFSLPVEVAYTATRAVFRNDFASDFGPWGTVSRGDRLPYVPEHQLAVGLGFETAQLGLYLNGRHASAVRTTAGQGAMIEAESVPSHFVMDVSAEYTVSSFSRVFLSVRNVTDEVYATARRPAGLRPGLPRTIIVGLKSTL